MLLCRTRPSPCKSGKIRAASFCTTSFAHTNAPAKICYASFRRRAYLFYLISAEAVLPAKKGNTLSSNIFPYKWYFTKNKYQQKRKQETYKSSNGDAQNRGAKPVVDTLPVKQSKEQCMAQVYA
jgi:hypothetical protein